MLGELKLPEGGIDAVQEPMDMSRIAELDHFQMSAVSTGSSWISGYDSENAVISVYSMQTGELVPVSMDGIPIASGDEPEWLDDHRLLQWVERLDCAVLWDADQRRATCLDQLPGPATYVLLRGKNTLIANTRKPSSEIWLVTLEDAAGEKQAP
jgi:hypothetical protein